MKTLTRLGSLSVLAMLAVMVAACGGRTASFDDDPLGPGGEAGSDTSTDTGGTSVDDTSIPWTDVDPGEDVTWVDVIEEDVWWVDSDPVFDTGTPIRDSGTPIKDTGTPIKDTGVIVTDSGVITTDSGVVIKDSGSTDTGIKDTGFDAGTLYTTCNKIAVATCNPAFEMCCKSSGFTWDYIGCEDISRNWCDDAVDGVVAGKTKYDASYADACAAGWKAMTSACQPHLFDWVKNQVPCSQLFNGTASPGAPCTRSTECRALAGEMAWCDDSSNRCRAFSVVPLGASCNYFGATVRWCDRGLTCDVMSGKCVTATPIGGSCFGIDDTSCGIGYSCRSGKCTTGSPPGASCVRDLECASWECQFGRCTDIRVPLASKALCGGI